MSTVVYTALGAPAATFQRIMHNERIEFYGALGRYEELDAIYSTGIFSPGRPGILHHDLDDVYSAKEQEVVSGRSWIPIWEVDEDLAIED